MILPFIRTYKKTFILFFLFIATLLYFLYKSHLQIAINNPQFKLNQIQKKPFEIV